MAVRRGDVVGWARVVRRITVALLLVATVSLPGLSWVAAQDRPQRPARQAHPIDPAYRARLRDVAEAAHERVERERARRVAPFDLWWGVR